jgi:DNA-binding transcriptional ArsR family regulator
MRAIDEGDAVERLKVLVDGWRANALKALAANDYRASVDSYLEVSVDARLYLLARPALLRHLEDLEDADDDACPEP